MKHLLIVSLTIMALIIALPAWGDSLNLKATWTANTDSATTGYKLYRTDGARVLVGAIPGKTTSSYLFTITVPAGSTGTATFVITATSATKESGDSNTASYPFDLSPVPVVPAGLGVVSQ